MTIIKLVVWWRKHIVMLFDLMDVYEHDGVMFISKMYWDKNKYYVQKVRVTLGFITSVWPFVLIRNHVLCKLKKLLHFARIFQNTSGFSPESAVRRITGNVTPFCQRTGTTVRS